MKTYKCSKCGNDAGFLLDEKQTRTGLYCAVCGKWIKWVTAEEKRLIERRKEQKPEAEQQQEPCEYCQCTDIIAGEGNHDGSITADLRLDVEDYNSLDVLICVNGSTLFDFSVDINYCPFCGRKLEVE